MTAFQLVSYSMKARQEINDGKVQCTVKCYVCYLFIPFADLTISPAKMGRVFLDHMGGTRLYSCANCDSNLTNRAELLSTRFTGSTGRAFLFNKVEISTDFEFDIASAIKFIS